ncbi:endonuclease VII [Pseudoalteromonas phage PH357]|nr:endonuclease VII [Pseudoalteromonas phage PH357]
MKICKKCGYTKSLEDFYAMKGNKDGRSGKCKECTKKDVSDNSKKVGNTYDYSYKGVIRVLYKTMKRHQKLRPHNEDVLPFNKDAFKIWLEDNGFQEKYEDWVISGYEKNVKPSVDRLDDYKGYSFDNMRLVTWKDNHNHQANDILEGKSRSGERCHTIGKYTTEGELIETYISYQHVRRELGYCVHYSVKNCSSCKGGFMWKLLN